VALTSVLVGLVPPSQAASEEFQGVSQAGSITVRMQVFPAAAGVNEVHLYFLQLDGSLAEVDAAELAIASDLVESRRIPLTMINASHAIAPNVDLTPGMWLFDVTVVTANEGGASTEFTVEIK